MPVPISAEAVSQALRERNFVELRRAFDALEPADIADAIEALEPEDRAVAFRVLRRDQATELFEHLESEAQEGLIHALAREHVAEILNDMSPDDRTALLEELPAEVTRQMLALLRPDERAVSRRLLGYPDDSIGRLMTPDYMAVHAGWTVREALDHIRRHGEDSETLNVINVVDERGKLTDDLRVRQLLLADPDARIDSLTDGNFIALHAADDQEEAVRVFSEYDRVAFPVVDSSGVLLGIVTVDDVLDVAEEEATEDIQKLGGSEALDQPFMQIGFRELVRKRGTWLIVLFLGQLLTLNAMGLFADRMVEMIVVALFVPMILSSGGNSGSQAATLVIRAMALDEVDVSDWWRVVRREALFGLLMGAVLATIGVLRIAVGSALGENLPDWPRLALVVAISLIAVVVWGVVFGSTLPLVLRRLGLDPATSSTPMIATVADITGVMIYLTLASTMLG